MPLGSGTPSWDTSQVHLEPSLLPQSHSSLTLAGWHNAGVPLLYSAAAEANDVQVKMPSFLHSWIRPEGKRTTCERSCCETQQKSCHALRLIFAVLHQKAVN